jgi:diketogulonate reductase-like aldo/keto reductase
MTTDGSVSPVRKPFIATKVWTTGRLAGIAQMKDSMRKLRVSVIDLMQVHNLVDVDTHLETLQEWKWEGRIRYIGVTHYTSSAHGAMEKVLRAYQVDFLQINYSLDEREAEQRLLPLARERGVAVIANRPFAEGALLRRVSKRPLPSIATELQCESWAQLALKFIVSHPAVMCAIPATSNLAHLHDSMRAGVGPLPTESQRAQIVAAAE